MSVPTLTLAQREAVIGFETAHLGLGETPPGSNISIPDEWYGLPGSAWCAQTVSWAFDMVLGYSPFPASTSKGFALCESGVQWFQSQGAWADGSVVPQRGWLVFYDWTGAGVAHHVGVVLGANGPRDIDTIEGNSATYPGGPDVIGLHHRRGSTIMGYGIIDYAGTPAPPPGPTPPPRVVHDYPKPLQRTLREHLQPLADPAQGLLETYAIQYLQDDMNVLSVVGGQPGLATPGFEGPGVFDSPTTLAVVWNKHRINEVCRVKNQPQPFPVNGHGFPSGDVGPKTLATFTWMAAPHR